MGSKDILWQDVTPKTAEEIFRRAKWLQADNRLLAAEYGLRFVEAKDRKTMLVLERCAEVLTRMNEQQNGEVQRQASTPFSMKFAPAEVSYFQEAYRAAADGKSEPAFAFLYAAAGEFAGHSIP